MKIQIPDDFDPEKSYGADNVSVPPHSPTVPSISSQGKTRCLYPRLERIPGKRTAPLTHGSGCGLLILIYLFLTSRSDVPFPQKIIFSGLRPDMEKVSASCGRILLKCSSPLLSPKGNPFPLYGVPWKNFVLPQERKLQKRADFYTFPSPSALGKLSVNELKNCSLGYRAAYIHATARMIAREKISFTEMETLSDKELTEKLLLFPGAGIKVVNCISLFAYHRTAAAPVDVWIGRVIQKHYGGVSPFPSYGHAAGIFQQYMFFYAQAKKLK